MSGVRAPLGGGARVVRVVRARSPLGAGVGIEERE